MHLGARAIAVDGGAFISVSARRSLKPVLDNEEIYLQLSNETQLRRGNESHLYIKAALILQHTITLLTQSHSRISTEWVGCDIRLQKGAVLKDDALISPSPHRWHLASRANVHLQLAHALQLNTVNCATQKYNDRSVFCSSRASFVALVSPHTTFSPTRQRLRGTTVRLSTLTLHCRKVAAEDLLCALILFPR